MNAGEPEYNDSPMQSTSGSVLFLDGIGPTINTKIAIYYSFVKL
jgi:hypothetical protein